MRLIVYLLLGQCIHYSFALYGENVRPARLREFPSVVSISDINDSEVAEMNQFCTGVLVSKVHVLTAAHCTEDSQTNETQVIVGSRDLRCGRKYNILWWVTYNRWTERKRLWRSYNVNDIAVIKLTEEVDNSMRPSPLSTAPNVFLFGLNVVTAGWGLTKTEEQPRMLHTVSLTLLSNSDCEVKIEAAHGIKVPIHERHLCSAAEPYAILPFGDSGAPIFYMGNVIAIHKSTAPFPELVIHPKKVNIHTSIDYYRRFVLSIINGHESWT